MRAMMSMVLVAAMAGTAMAQAPGQPAPQPQPYAQPAPQPYPQPYPQQPMGPQYGYGQRPVMQYQLTVDEQYLLERGFISDGAWIGGAVANVFVGFGIGQAIQGRWMERGYIFTLGEGASFVAMIWGMSQFFESCIASDVSCEEGRGFGLMMAGVLGYSVFHIWSILDAIVVPPSHNSKVRSLHLRLGMQPMYARVAPYVATPRGDSGGAVAGLSFRF